jgi:protein-L-isoaspartate(D-aspartate) O-methyltransferase
LEADVSLETAQQTRDDESQEVLASFILSLRAHGFRNTQLLNAVERAPRTSFLPPEFSGFAYEPMTLPLPCGQEAASPYAIVEAVAALQIKPQHHVLEIGTGSGWQTALIGALASAVVSVERWKTLADAAEARLASLDFRNAVVAHGDGSGGLPAAAPFDRIIINGAIDDFSSILEAQLAEGGMVITPVISEEGQFLIRYEKRGDRMFESSLGPFSAMPLAMGTASIL